MVTPPTAFSAPPLNLGLPDRLSNDTGDQQSIAQRNLHPILQQSNVPQVLV